MGGQDLSEIPTEQLVHEVQRRLECLNKPEKRLILIGELQEASFCSCDMRRRQHCAWGAHGPPFTWERCAVLPLPPAARSATVPPGRMPCLLGA
jgi:hypothetical protein